MKIDRTIALVVFLVAAIVAMTAMMTYHLDPAWHDVTYHGNGGLTEDGRDVTYSDGAHAEGCEFIREGYVFVEWNTEADGSGTAYVPNQVVVLSLPLKVYAQWAPV